MDPCNYCGSYSITLEDGIYYCGECGGENLGKELVDAFDGNNFLARAVGQKENLIDRSLILSNNETTVARRIVERANNHNYGISAALPVLGRRISTATHIVYNISAILVLEIGIPDKVGDTAVALLQKYLQKFKVAFCEEEMGKDGDEKYKVRVPLSNLEVKKLIRKKFVEEKRWKDENEMTVLLNMSVFDISRNNTQNESQNDPRNMSQFVMHPEDYYKIVDTNLAMQAVETSGHVYLELDVLLAIVHLSLQLNGVLHVTFADLIRWYREGRFWVTEDQLNDLQFANYKGNEVVSTVKRAEPFTATRTAFSRPLCRTYYAEMFLTQFLDINICRDSETEFDRLVGRYLYNLNLPKQFAKLISAFRVQFNPVKYPSVLLRNNIVPIIPNPVDLINECFKKESISYESYYHKLMPDVVGNNELKKDYIIDLSVEVKAMALILFALKYEYGLDDQTEFEFSEIENSFSFIKWLNQLDGRIGLAELKPLSLAFSEKRKVDFKAERWEAVNSRGWNINTSYFRYFETNFEHCLPPIHLQNSNSKSFADVFEDKLPTPSDVSCLEIFMAPLKYYGENCQKIKNDSSHLYKKAKASFMDKTLKEKSGETTIQYSKYGCPKHLKCFKITGNERSLECDAMLYIYPSSLQTLYEDSFNHLPNSFIRLIYYFSKIIGDHPHVLFYTFLCTEAALLEKSEIKRLKKYLQEGNYVKLHHNGGTGIYGQQYYLSLDPTCNLNKPCSWKFKMVSY
uniref:TATA box-binding protein-associated factor RNA polymerase I subunit B n=1 Tax=Rhabditophanes sp. KR3021 TaxID=114890 RepID=A0AC35TPD4_9BILA